MGVVYSARHAETGQEVALKTIVSADGAVSGILREIYALSQVRHPGVVRIVGDGVSHGLPWYAMEAVGGRTLRQRIEEAWGGAESRGSKELPAGDLQDVLTVCRRLCSPLEYLHGEGFVHRDLTPANVLIRDDGTPVLVDFGLAAQFRGVGGRDVIEVGGVLVGTCAYMAPEQICGDVVDARADLYSLGCILFEAVTGKPPFLGANAGEVLTRHLNDEPVPPSMRVPVPRELDDLIMALLAKDPRNRIGYASDVAAVLGSCGATAWEAAERIRPQSYVYRPALSGRDEILDEFQPLLAGVRSGKGGLVLLGGESGIGKTRLAAEIATRARVERCIVVAAECTPVSISGSADQTVRGAALHPLRPFLQLVADRCRELGREETDRLLGARGRVLAAYEPMLASLPGFLDHPEPPVLSGPDARYRLFRILEETIAAAAFKRPIVLVLDDLQWADDLTLAFLKALPEEFVTSTGVLILATYRSEETTPLLDEIRQLAWVRSFVLGRLREPTVRSMVSDMLATEPPADLVRVLSDESEGIPFFVSEYVRAAVDEGLLARDLSGRWEARGEGGEVGQSVARLPLPTTLQDLVARRLSQVPGTGAQLIEAAACLGREFPADVLLSMAETDDVGEAVALQELTRRQVLEDAGNGYLRFAHDKLREVSYLQIAGERRSGLHRRAAESIEQWVSGQRDVAAWYPTLAHHWSIAGVAEKELTYVEKAGDTALDAAAFDAARDFFRRALELEMRVRRDDSRFASRRGRWQRRLAESFWGLGDLASCNEHFTEALRTLGYRTPKSTTGWIAASAVRGMRQLAYLRPARHRHSVSREAKEVLQEAGLAAARQSQQYYFSGKMLSMIGSVLLAVNLAERARADLPVATQYSQLGYLSGIAGLRRLSEAYFRRAHDNGSRTNDLQGMVAAVYQEVAYYVGEAKWSDARRVGATAMELAERLGNPQELETALTVLGHGDFCAGDFALNYQRSQQLLESARARANQQHVAWGLYSLGRNLLARGDVDGAIELFEQARPILARLSDRGSNVICLGLLGLACLRRGDQAAARSMADAALQSMRGLIPAVFPTGHGYAAVVETYLGLLESHAPAAGPPRRAVWESCAYLWWYAALFPIGRPSAYVLTARALRLSGRPRAARRFASRGAGVARRLEMPFEGAMARLELARLAASDPSARAEHLEAAREAFLRLGCAYHVALVGREAGLDPFESSVAPVSHPPGRD